MAGNPHILTLNPDRGQGQGLSFERLYHAVMAWSAKQFGDADRRGPKGPLRHLEKEAGEAIQAWDVLMGHGGVTGPNVPDEVKRAFLFELADIQILLFDAMWRAHIHPVHLLNFAELKMVRNVSRAWPESSADQPVEHVRSAGEKKPEPLPFIDGGSNNEFGGGI